MAVRPVHVLLISLLLYELASGKYCRNEDNPSIPFCQSGTISGSKVYINGSSVKTKEELIDRGCVCYLEQVGNNEIYVDAKESCMYCGLQVLIGPFIFRSSFYNSQGHGWRWIQLNDSKFTMILGLDGSADRPNTAFCITIQPTLPDVPSVLTLTCEDNVTGSSNAKSTSPNMVPCTTKSLTPTSAETAISLPKTETTKNTEVSAGNTNVTHGPKANNTYKVTTITTTGNDPGEPRFQIQKGEIVVGAAVGGSCGGVVLVIVINVIIFICYKRRIKNKYMQRQSTAPARVYTELEFGSRDGQNDNHVYNSIEPQQIYNNNVQ